MAIPIHCCPPPPACRETPAVPCCTHRQASQNSGKSHLLEVYESDILKNFKQNQCITPLAIITIFIIFFDRFTWTFRGQKQSLFQLLAANSPYQLQKGKIPLEPILSTAFLTHYEVLLLADFRRVLPGITYKEKDLVSLLLHSRSLLEVNRHNFTGNKWCIFLKQALYVLIYSVRRKTRLKQNPVS